MGGDYFLFVFVVSLGVLQLVGARGRFEGITFFPRRYLNYLFAAVMVVGGYAWHFRIDCNIQGYMGAPSGPSLFAYATAAVVVSVLLTLIISSAVKTRWGRPDSEGEQRGLKVLRRMTYVQAINRLLRRES